MSYLKKQTTKTTVFMVVFLIFFVAPLGIEPRFKV